MRIGFYFAVLGIASSLLACGKSSSPAQEDLYKGWVELTATPSDPAISQPTITYAASPELPPAAHDYPPMNDCKLTDVRHAFILGKREFSLGEPIEVEYRVELEGPGTWHEPFGGNYRFGNDSNFLFLVRHEDGTWGTPTGPQGCGGLLSLDFVTMEKSHTERKKVQDYSVIDKPGHYDLFCFHRHVCFSGPKKEMGFSPIMKRMPENIHAFRAEFYRKYTNPSDKVPFDTCKSDKASLAICKTEEDWDQYHLMRNWIYHIEYADAFAHFTIVVRDKAAESVKGLSTNTP